MIILIDNYDSFTYNLVQYLGDLGADVVVHRNDKITTENVIAEKPAGILISPGPSDPDSAGICLELIGAAAENDIPLFGVCLGHQSIGQYFGGDVIRGDKPMHGKVSTITHIGHDMFAGIDETFDVTRYHSLVIDPQTLPESLEATAHSEDGTIMAIAHKEKNITGVQFHPESIATENGHKILNNFLKSF